MPFLGVYQRPQNMKKIISTALLSLTLALSFSNASAQKMLEAMPEKSSFQNRVIEGVFHLNAGSAVDLKFNEDVRITGIVRSNEKVYDNLQTVVIECTNYNKAKFFLSKIRDENNQIKYVGRMIGRGFQDGLELRADQNGNNIKKINIREMIVE